MNAFALVAVLIMTFMASVGILLNGIAGIRQSRLDGLLFELHHGHEEREHGKRE